MNDLRDAIERVERATGSATLPTGSFDRVVALRDRRQRDRRIRAAAVSVLVVVLAFGLFLRAAGFRAPQPATPPEVTSTTMIGTAGTDEAWAVAALGGTAFVVGDTTGSLHGENAGGFDAYVRAIEADGRTLWTDQFGTTGGDYGFGVAADVSGVYVSGSTVGDLASRSAGGQDAFLRAYDASGRVRWTQQFGGASTDSGDSVTIGPQGIYVAGYSRARIVGATGRAAGGFLAAFATDGRRLWIRELPARAFAVSADPSGIYVAGQGFVVKFDDSGERLWNVDLPSDRSAPVLGLGADGSGVYAVGEFVAGNGDTDVFVRRYSPEGREFWTTRIGTSAEDSADCVAVDATGVVVTGTTAGRIGADRPVGGTDVFVSHLDRTGAVGWTTQFGTSGADEHPCIATLPGGLVVSGQTDAAFGGAANAGDLDAFLARLSVAANDPSTEGA